MLLSAWRVVLMRISESFDLWGVVFCSRFAARELLALSFQHSAQLEWHHAHGHMVVMILDIYFAFGHIANFGL